MDRGVLLAIVIAIGVLLLALMLLGWRARLRRQRDVAAPHPVPDATGAVLGEFRGSYVATVIAGTRYERIAVHGLGFRGPVRLTVAEDGIAVAITGAPEFWIPHEQLHDHRRTSATIDRAVEHEGLQLLEWSLGELRVESTFRLPDPRGFESALAQQRAERTTP